MTHDPHHTWTTSKDSFLIRRVYSGVWGLDARDVNFCKLFWATVLLPIGIVLWLVLNFGRLFVGVVAPIFEWVGERLPRRKNSWDNMTREQKIAWAENLDAKKQRRKERMEKLFNKLSGWVSPIADKVAAFFQHGWVKNIGIFLIAAWVAFAVIYALVTNPIGFLLGLGLGLGLIALVVVFFWLGDNGHFGKVGNKVTGLFRFLGRGFKAVKDRTCPAIEVEGLDTYPNAKRA